MGQCRQCMQIVPPDCMNEQGDKCEFCISGQNYKMVIDNMTGKVVEMTKDFAIQDYHKFLEKIAKSGNVKDTLQDMMNKATMGK